MNIAIELATPLNIIRMGIRNEMGALMKRAVRQATGSVYWEDGTEMNCYLIYKAHLIPGFEIMAIGLSTPPYSTLGISMLRSISG